VGETERREREEEGAVVTMEIREGRRRWTVDEEEGEEGAIQKKQDGRGVGVGGMGGKKKEREREELDEASEPRLSVLSSLQSSDRAFNEVTSSSLHISKE